MAVASVTLASAQAAPQTKLYDAYVRVVGGNSCGSSTTGRTCTFRLTLVNDSSSTQTLGAANFTAPSGWSAAAGTQSVTSGDGHAWSVAADGSSLVTFRAVSNGDAIAPGQSVSADVAVSFPSSCSAHWTTEARQANTFNGPPGNGFLLADADLTPLGSLAFGSIGTQVTGRQFTASATATDVCGTLRTDYGGATLTHHGLTGAGFDPSSGLDWSGGTGTVMITPSATESGNTLTATDGPTGITATGNAFSVVARLCSSSDSSPCHWQADDGTTSVDAPSPSGGATLGLGGGNAIAFSCGSTSSHIGTLVLVDPQGYGDSVTLTLTYPKSASGTGPANGYVVCISKDDGATWTALTDCDAPTPTASCVVSRKRVTGGALEVVLTIDPSDPWVATS